MSAYPRPDYQRKQLRWMSLDGIWDFAFDDQDCGQTLRWQQRGLPSHAKRPIKVPYAFQTPASGIGLSEPHEVIWYERIITDIRTADEVNGGDRLLVRFGAVDYECSVWIDGRFVGGHRGGDILILFVYIIFQHRPSARTRLGSQQGHLSAAPSFRATHVCQAL